MTKRRGSTVLREKGRRAKQNNRTATPQRIYTPFRILRSRPTDVADTPYKTKFPLMAFLNVKFASLDMELKMKAQRIVSHSDQQSMIEKLDAMLEICSIKDSSQNVLICELMRQYMIAVLDDLPDAAAVLQTLSEVMAAAALKDASAKLALENEAPTPKKTQALQLPAPPLPQGPRISDRTRSKSRGSQPSTPMKSTPTNSLPIGQPPSRLDMTNMQLANLSKSLEAEPEHVRLRMRKRLSCITEETEEEFRALSLVMEAVVYSTKMSSHVLETPAKKPRLNKTRKPVSDSSETLTESLAEHPYSVAVTIGDTPETVMKAKPGKARATKRKARKSKEFGGLISILSKPSASDLFDTIDEGNEENENEEKNADTPPTINRSRKSAGELTTDASSQSAIVSTSADTNAVVSASQPRQFEDVDDIKISRRSSVASMFTSRGAPQRGNKFQSRASLTAKLRNTREKRGMRSLREELEEEESEILVQAGSKVRRLERFEALAESKYTAFTDGNQLANLQTVFTSSERAQLTYDCMDPQEGRPNWSHLLKELYSHDKFRDLQEESLNYLWSGVNETLLLSLPTGAGKSAVFTLFGAACCCVKNGVNIMILPTRALASDQFEAAKRHLSTRFNVLKLYGGLDVSDYAALYRGLAAGLVDFVLTTPEQFISTSLLTALRKSPRPVTTICVDEAHCLSEWSHTFRPAYQSVLAVANHYFKDARKLLMTATITKETQESIVQATSSLSSTGVSNVEIKSVEEGFRRTDLEITVRHASDTSIELLVRLMSAERKKWKRSTQLVFVWMKYQAEQVVRHLKQHNVGENIYFYHSEISELEKQKLTHLLLSGQVDVLVSTQALGMGLDVHHITNVYHLSIPGSIEQWLQEMGRCNRDHRAKKAMCYGFGVYKEYWKRRQKTAGSCIDDVAVRQLLKTLLNAEDPTIVKVANPKEMRSKLNSKALKDKILRWQGEKHSLSVVDLNNVKTMLNCWTEDELMVISAIVERQCLEDRIANKQCLGWWILSDLEIRCFEKDLDALGEAGGIITELRSTCWKDRANQGVYRLRWAELLASDRDIDPLEIREQIYAISQENRVSVRAAANTRRLLVRKTEEDLSALSKTLSERVISAMTKNNEAQLKKQELVRLAWKVNEEQGEEVFHRMLRMYFDNKIAWPPKEVQIRKWLYEGIQTLDDDPGALAVFQNDVTILRESLVTQNMVATPLACARILCGLQKPSQGAQSWYGRYESVPFEIVHRLARLPT